LPIISHREVDRGIKGGHIDPVDFEFKRFYEILKKKDVPIDSIEKQSQQRFDQMPWCEHAWIWPPVLSGSNFKKVTADIYKAKGC